MKNLIQLLLLISPIFMQAQKSEKYFVFWRDTATGVVHNKLISILESEEKEIYLLGKGTDESYQNPQATFTRMDLKGNILNSKVVGNRQLYELNNIVILPDKKIKISGTTTNGGLMQYTETIDKKGVLDPYVHTFNLVQFFNGKCIKLKDGKYLTSMSTRNNAGGADDADPNEPGALWNMWVYKLDYADGKINGSEIWHKKLLSEYHEEIVDVVQTSDEGIAVLGRRFTSSDFSTYIPVIYKLNKEGQIVWNKEFEGAENYGFAALAAGKDAQLMLSYCNEYERSGINKSTVYKLSAAGDSIAGFTSSEIGIKGVLSLKNGNCLLYGSVFKADINAMIKRAKTILLSSEWKEISKDEIDIMDEPDVSIPGMGMFVYGCSTDIFAALELSNGKIALAGKVYMPSVTKGTSTDVMLSTRYNSNYLIFADPTGKMGADLE